MRFNQIRHSGRRMTLRRRRKGRNEFSGRRYARKLRSRRTELWQNIVSKGRSRRSKNCGCAAGYYGLARDYASSSIH